MITDETGKQFPALKVLAYTIRYLKSQVLNDICLRGHDVEADDIKWVLTVPSAFTDLAKQFMRKAAETVNTSQNSAFISEMLLDKNTHKIMMRAPSVDCDQSSLCSHWIASED